MPKILTTEYTDEEKENIRDKPYLDFAFPVFMKSMNDIMARMGIKNKVEVSSKIIDLLLDK